MKEKVKGKREEKRKREGKEKREEKGKKEGKGKKESERKFRTFIVEFVNIKSLKLKDPILIEGLPGIGFVLLK
ncbi:MAG: hypothetical protein QXI58_03660 [Candidatus Micrarchaeia archaeon]